MGWAPPGSMVPWDPSNCRGWMRLSCRPAFQRTVRTTGAATTKVDVPRRSLPSPHPQARSPILGGSEGRFKATAGNCLPPRCNLTRGRRARRGNGIGNASCGCPVLHGVRRRHLFSCQGTSPACRGGLPRLRDYQRRIHTARFQRGGVNPRHCARGYGVTVPSASGLSVKGQG